MKNSFFKMAIASTMVCSFLLPIISNTANAEPIEGGTGQARGVGHTYSLTAAKGWAIDVEAAKAEGISMVFYPTGSSWKESSAVIYTRPIGRDSKIRRTQDAVNNVVKDFRQNGHPKYSAAFKNNLKIDDQRTAKIYWFKGDNFGGLEAVAYIEEAKTINFVVLNARNAKAFQAALPAFTEIVKSYQPQ
jgi:hypothetical protein